MRAGQVGPAHKPEPTAAQMTLHTILIGIVRKLPNRGEDRELITKHFKHSGSLQNATTSRGGRNGAVALKPSSRR